MVEQFRDDLLDAGRSKAMAQRVLRSLTSIVKEAKRLGYVAQNVCEDVTLKRGSREKPKVVPPTKQHIRQLIDQAAKGRPMDKPLLLVLVFAGLRASEVRGLTWENVDLRRGTITVDHRADYRNIIGPPKSASGYRTIPIPQLVVTELRKWNTAHAKAGAIKYGQSRLDISDEVDLEKDRPRYEADSAKDIALTTTNGIDAVVKKFQLDALIFPASSGAGLSARPGYPTVIVPFAMVPNEPTPPFPEGFNAKPQPYGVSFAGLACGESKLLALAYAFEQATKRRVPPAAAP